jgi:hypothetical protein
MTTYRVTYPLISRDATRDFDSRAEAEAFATERRNLNSTYQTIHAWRRVQVEEIVR